MNKSDKNQIETELHKLLFVGQDCMIAFDFTHDKITLDQAGLLPKDTHVDFVRDLKTDPVIMVCCNSSYCNSTSRTLLGLRDVYKVMANKRIDKKVQCSNWTMDNNLSKEAKDYGAFDAYVIWWISAYEH